MTHCCPVAHPDQGERRSLYYRDCTCLEVFIANKSCIRHRVFSPTGISYPTGIKRNLGEGSTAAGGWADSNLTVAPCRFLPPIPPGLAMTSSLLEKRTLIDELDSRQDEVIAQLDELNQRIEAVIQEWLSDRVDGGEQSVTTIAQSGTAVSV